MTNHPRPGATTRRPKSVDTAVMFMYAGAALSLLEIVLALVMSSQIKENIRERLGETVTAAELESAIGSLTWQTILGGAFGVALWLAMAYFNQRGMSWARIVGTVLFGISTLRLLIQMLAVPPIPLVAVVFLLWVAGLGAVICLWKRESSAWFEAVSRGR